MQQLSLSSNAVYILSVNEASAGKWERVGAEHLFLALCKASRFERADSEMIVQQLGKGQGDVDGVQADFGAIKGVFTRASVDPQRTRYALREVIGKGGFNHQDSTLHRTDECRQVYREADRLVKETGSTAVKPIHLLWALANAADSMPLRYLRKEGVDVSRLVDICREAAGGKSGAGTSPKEPKESAKTPPAAPKT